MADDKPARKSTSKSSAVALQGIAKLTGLVIQFFFLRLCVLWLGATGYGTYVFAVSAAAFLGLVDFGMTAATQRFLGEAMAKGDLVRVASLFRFARIAQGLFAGLGLLVLVTVALVYNWDFAHRAVDPSALLLLLCGLQIGTVLITNPALTVAYAFERFREVAAINFIQAALTPALGIAMLYYFRTPESLAASTVIGGVVSAVLAYRLCGARALPKAERLTKDDRRALFSLSARGYPISIATVVGANADKVMVQRVGSPGSLAAYYVAGRLPDTIFQVVFPLAATVYPELTRLASTDSEAFNRVVERNTRFSLALAGSLIIVPSALSECILRFWLHDAFVNANPGVTLVLPLMALYKALELVYGVMAMAYFANGVPQFGLPFAAFNAAVTVLATAPMYRWQGIAGVGLMNALIDLTQAAPMVYMLKRFAAPGVRGSHLAGGFAGTLGLSAVLFFLLKFGVDRPLAHIAPAAGFFLAPVAALLAIGMMVRLQICEVPNSVAARLRRLPLGPLILGATKSM
ncbi:MAG: lipopolysaccharide biosynthesis protein [Fimbriimonadaceae bacterium]